ncbi:MAG: type II toxin-antitoxin system VapC family toxin [Bryobacteraceae bacterium]|jgi:toxin-antitoxin system PIN domain toxin
MKILDANLLLYAVNRDTPLHAKAKACLERSLTGDEPVAFAWNVILAFLRLTTRPGLFRQPLAPDEAFDLIESWLAEPTARLVAPGPRHLSILRTLLAPLGTAGNLTSDAHLAALAIEQNAQLCSCDADFARFPALDWQNPLR